MAKLKLFNKWGRGRRFLGFRAPAALLFAGAISWSPNAHAQQTGQRFEFAVPGLLPVENGGTARINFTNQGILYGDNGQISAVYPGGKGDLLMGGGSSSNPIFKTLRSLQPLTFNPNAVSPQAHFNLGIVPVSNGGTGLSQLPANSILFGNGISPISAVNASTGYQVLTSRGTADTPFYRSLGASNSVILTQTGTDFKFSLGSVLSVGVGGTGLGSITPGAVFIGDIEGSLIHVASTASGQLLMGNGSTTIPARPSFAAISGASPISYNSTLNQWSLGTVGVAQGGTGRSSYSNTNLLFGSGTSPVNLAPAGAAGSFLVGLGSSTPGNFVVPQGSGFVSYDPTAGNFFIPSLTVAQGGTGASSFESNGVIFGGGSGVLTSTVPGTVGNFLWVNSALVPVWQPITVQTPISFDVSSSNFSIDTIPVSFGGTGKTSMTTHLLQLGNGTGVIQEVASIGSGQVLISDSSSVPKFQSLQGTSPVVYTSGTRVFSLTTVPASFGGTGAVTLSNNQLLLGQGTQPVSSVGAGTFGQVLTGSTGADPSFQAAAGQWFVFNQTSSTCSIDGTASYRIYLENGGQTCTLPSSPATGFQVQFRKYDTGTSPLVVQSPNSYSIDGSSTATLSYVGDWLWLSFDGTRWLVLSQALAASDSSRAFESNQIYTSGSNTFVVPAEVYVLRVSVLGGGGGGGIAWGGLFTNPCGGGGGGGYAERTLAVTPGASYTVEVGAGGPAGSAGGPSAFGLGGTNLVVGGGGDGGSTDVSGTGGAGGAGTLGDFNMTGGSGGAGGKFSDGGGTYFLGGGGGSGGGMNGPGFPGRSPLMSAVLGTTRLLSGHGGKGSGSASAGTSVTLSYSNRNSGGGGDYSVVDDSKAGDYGSGGGGCGYVDFARDAGNGSGGFVVIQY